MNKDSSYFVFLDALDKPGCPICHLVLENSRGFLDGLMYERVLDVPTRLDLMDSFGFCNWHAWQIPALPAISNPIVGFAICASDLLRKFDYLAQATIERDQDERSWQRRIKKLFRTVTLFSRMKGKTCPICVHVAQAEYYHVRELMDFIKDEQFLSAYKASNGICLPHFFSLVQTCANHANYPALLKLQLGNVRSLRTTIDEFIRKQDHRFRDEITSSESKAWRIAMELLAGKPGVFHNEMGHDLSLKSRGAPMADSKVASMWSADSYGLHELTNELKTVKQITLSLKRPLPSDLFEALRRIAQEPPNGAMEATVEDLNDVAYLRELHGAGFALFYGIGLLRQSILLLDRKRGFVLEEDQSKAKWKARPLKDAEDFCLSLLWHRFGIAVLLSGSVTGIDAANGLCCLTVDGRSDQWCRFRERLANKLPDIGARVEVFGWEKWNARIVEVMELTTR